MSLGARGALLATLLVALLGFGAAGHAAAGLDRPVAQTDGPGGSTNVTMVADLQPDGDATWTVSASFALSTDAERDAFRSLAQSFERGETSDLGLSAFRRASEQASRSTGRNMSITTVERRTSPESEIENGTGRLAVEFTWTNFGRPNGDRLHVDDVLVAGPDGETWLPGLERGDTLVIRAPPGYGVIDSNVAPKVRDNRSTLQWTGPAEFTAETLAAEFTGQADPGSTPPGNPQGAIPWLLVFAVGLGGGVVAVYLLARRERYDLPSPPAGGGEEVATSTADESPTKDATAEPETDESVEEEGPDIDEELLSDEERVEHLLERNGGRMKQANIVNETGWSNAKVSQLLSSMEEEGRIDKLRIGRENLISFPDEDVTDIEE
ncbi:MAG: hypothetical protein V5A39_08080 [Haloarculaceae archaeon]